MKDRRTLSDKLADTIACSFFVVVFAVLALAVAGCAQAPKPPREVLVPVLKSCVPPELEPPPLRYADHDLATTADPAERMRKVGAANLERKGRLAVVEPVLAACR